MLSWAWFGGAIRIWVGLMNCKAAIAALAVVAYAAPVGTSWSETVIIAWHADGGTGSDVPATVNEAGLDRPATGDHPEGGADSLALGGRSAPDAIALRSGETGDNAPTAIGSVAAPEPSMLTRLLIMFSDLRAQVVGGP